MAHRHNPYAGYTMPGRRGGGSPGGPGPDRPQRQFERGGRPPRGRRGGHNQYPQQQDHGYGNAGFSESPYSRNGAANEYNPYQSYENDQSYGFQENPKTESEDKTHNPLIVERLQRERPCRTLFIRNIKYETDSIEFRHKFEEFGEIKTFFDLISHRGMVFCTYFDTRAAERAKERLQGTELAGRPIDVHYSLPREDQTKERNQGYLIVTLVESPTRAAIDDNELRRKCQVFGDVKSITPNNNRQDSKYVEFYDIRSCEEAQIKLRHQNLQDGIIETDFGDPHDSNLPPGPAMLEHGQARADGRYEPPTNNRGRGRGRGRGGRPDRGGGRWGESRDDDYGRYDDRPMSPRGRFGGRDPRDRSPDRRGYAPVEPHVDPAEATRREQAKKVQDLLDALKGTPSSTPQQQPSAPHNGLGSQQNYYPPPPQSNSAPAQHAPPLAPAYANPLAALLNPATLTSLLQGQLGQQSGQQSTAPLPPGYQQAYEQILRAALPQLANVQPPPPPPPSSLPPPSAMFGQALPPPHHPLPPFPPQHAPASNLPPPPPSRQHNQQNPSGPPATNGYDATASSNGLPMNIMQLLGSQAASQGNGNESNTNNGYAPYGRPNGSGASGPSSSGNPPTNIQDIMALLKSSSG